MGPRNELANVVVIGAGGAVGRLFAGVLAAAGSALTLVDVAPEPHAELRALGPYAALDARRPSPGLEAALARADCALLALPETIALDALPHVVAALPAGALVVDTLSVKTPFAHAALMAARNIQLLSLNPMFAPSLGFAGRPVLAIELAPGPRSQALLALLEELGARVVAVRDAEEHDRATAALQVATHAGLLSFGLALERLGVELETLLPLAPPPFLAQLALLARIAVGAPETYADIQRTNLFAIEARDALTAALAALDDAARDADPARLERLIVDAGELLGPHREALAAQAATLLAQVEAPRPDS